jgi:hypothetical protein
MDGYMSEPATKQDLLDLRSELKGDISGLRTVLKQDISDLRSELKGDISGLRDELVEAIRDSQTEVLRAIYGYTQSIQVRLGEQDEAKAALSRRMAILEERVLALELRPPAA